MGMRQYTWAQFTSLGGNPVDTQDLWSEWGSSSINNLLTWIDVDDGDDVTFFYLGSLDTGEETTLDAIVAAHTGIGTPVTTTPGAHLLRPTFAIWAEENSAVNVAANNFEYSFGNGAVNTTADAPGIPMLDCTLIGIAVSARNALAGSSSVSVSVTRNGVVVATGGIASGSTQNAKIEDFTDVTPDTVNFAKGDTLQFLTASASGTVDDVRVVAWFERTA